MAKVVESKDPQYPVGSLIVSHEGWCDKGKINPAKMATNLIGGHGVKLATDLKGTILMRRLQNLWILNSLSSSLPTIFTDFLYK